MKLNYRLCAAFVLAASLLAGVDTDMARADYSPGNNPSGIRTDYHVQFYKSQDHLDRDPVLGSSSEMPVGTALTIAWDSSQSMSQKEWNMQRRVTAEVFRDPLVKDAIRCKTGPHAISVSLVEFSREAHTRIAWVDLRANSCQGDDPAFDAKVDAFANAIEHIERGQAGDTCTAALLEYSLKHFQASPWEPIEHRVLDVSSDGKATACPHDFYKSRDLLEAEGVKINGLAIVNEERDLQRWMETELVSRLSLNSPDGMTNSGRGQVWVAAEAPSDEMVGDFKGYLLRQALISKITQEISALLLSYGPG